MTNLNKREMKKVTVVFLYHESYMEKKESVVLEQLISPSYICFLFMTCNKIHKS